MNTRLNKRLGRAIASLAGVSLLVAGPLGGSAMAAPDQADGVAVLARDVYVVVGSALRNPDSGTDVDAPLFTVSGIALASANADWVTWGRWSAASATSTARTIGGPDGPRTDVRIDMSGLLPGGVYSVFYGTLSPDSVHPLCPSERTLPLDAFQPERQRPAPNAFVAGPDGGAVFRGLVKAAVLEAAQVFINVVFHFSGTTTYPFPIREELETQGDGCRGTYGEDAIRHLTILQKS